MANELDCGLKVSGFELQSRWYGDFQSNTLEKSMNTLNSQVVG